MRRGVLGLLVLLCGCLLASSVAAQDSQAFEKIYMTSGGTVHSTWSIGSGAPSGGSTGDFYLDYASGDVYTKLSGGWEKLPRFSEGGTWTAAPAFSAGWTGTTGSLSSTLHVGGNFDVATTMATIAAATGNTSIAGTLHAGGNFDVNTSKFTVTASTGATTVAGTLQATSTAVDSDGVQSAAYLGGSKRVDIGYNTTGDYGFVAAVNTGSSWEPLVLQPVSGSVGIGVSPSSKLDVNGQVTFRTDAMPYTGYTSNLGSLSDKYLTLHAAELWVETLVAQSTLATIGGRVLVGPTNELSQDAAAGDTTLHFKYNNLSNGDRVYFEANGSVEFMAVTSSAGGSSGNYTYTVTRDLDGTGANAWSAGSAAFDTGQTGSGFIDLYSISGVKSTNEAGPTIVGNIRLSSTYNDWAPRWAIGNLKNLYGYGSSVVYGVAFGDPSATNITIDATNGLRIRNGTTNKLTADTSGNLSLVGNLSVGTSGSFSSGATAIQTGVGWWMDYNGGSPRFRIGDPAGNELFWDGTGLNLSNGLKLCEDQTCTINATLNAYYFDGSTFHGGLSTAYIGANTLLAAPQLNLVTGSGSGGIAVHTFASGYVTALDTLYYGLTSLATMLRLGNGVTATEVATSLLVGASGTTAPAATLEVNGTTQLDDIVTVAANGRHFIGAGGTTTSTALRLNGGDGTGLGPWIELAKNGTVYGHVGLESGILGSGTSSNLTLYSGSNGIVMYANGTLRATLTSTGLFGLGISPSNPLAVQSATDGTVFLNNTNSTTTRTMIQFDVSSSAIASITCTVSACAYNTTSDERLKKFAPSHFGILDVMKIDIIDFSRTDLPDDPTVHTGVKAQQLFAVYPEAVTRPNDLTAACAPGDKSGCWAVDYGKLTPLLMKGEQDLQREINALTARVAKLEGGKQ